VQEPHRTQRFGLRTLTTDSVVLDLIDIVQTDANFQGIARLALQDRQRVSHRWRNQCAIGQNCRWGNLQRSGENGQDLLVKKWLTTGEVHFSHAKLSGLIEVPVNGVRFKKPEAVIGGATGDKTMLALKVAKRSGELKPEDLKMTKRNPRG
jgi:hypothetical protein